MFKILVLQHLYNLSDGQTEFQIRDRYSFCRFLGLSPEGKVPDAKTLWVYRERLKELDLVDRLFSELLAQIDAAGFSARKGQIVDLKAAGSLLIFLPHTPSLELRRKKQNGGERSRNSRISLVCVEENLNLGSEFVIYQRAQLSHQTAPGPIWK